MSNDNILVADIMKDNPYIEELRKKVYLFGKDDDIEIIIDCENKLKEETIKTAQSMENPPALIFVEVPVEVYEDSWECARVVYLRDETGVYIPTDVYDELYFQNDYSEIEPQLMHRGNLLVTEKGIYHRNEETGQYSILENGKDCKYSVRSNNTYWRRDKSREVIVSRNPVTGEFEDIQSGMLNADDNHMYRYEYGEHGITNVVIYKRDNEDGKFYPDAEFPTWINPDITPSTDGLEMEFQGVGNPEGMDIKYIDKGGVSSLWMRKYGPPFNERVDGSYTVKSWFRSYKRVDKFDQSEKINTSDHVQQKVDEIKENLRKRMLSYKDMGKTGNSVTGEVTEKDKLVAKIQTDIAKKMIKKRREDLSK